MNDQKKIYVSGPVIIEDGKVLLNREKEEDGKGEEFFMLPGGQMDPGESPEEACKREVMEELGIEIEIITQLKTIEAAHLTQPDVTVVLHHFLAKRKGEITPGEETIEWGWYPLDNLPELTAPITKNMLENITEQL